MANYAGAYGAGGAADALRQLIADKLVQQKFEEQKRHTKVTEDERAGERRDAASYQQQQADLEAARNEAATQNRYEDRTDRRRMFDVEQQQHANDQIVRAKERADDREAGLEGEDRAFGRQKELLKSRQDFERQMLQARGAGAGDNEPLVSITDPTTGQPKLVKRSEAVGQRPASTREQALTEGQSNAAGFADRMKFNEPSIQNYEGQIGRLSQLQGLLPGEFQSPQLQQYNAAKKNWIASQLRKESGAAISQGEYQEADQQYFPQPGDAPEVIKQKRELRAVAEASMRRGSGSAAGDGVSAPMAPAATGAPMTRTLRNARGETRQQVSADGGKTWAWAN